MDFTPTSYLLPAYPFSPSSI